jgi:hypothetical protein
MGRRRASRRSAQNAPGKAERARRQTPPSTPASARIVPAGFLGGTSRWTISGDLEP